MHQFEQHELTEKAMSRLDEAQHAGMAYYEDQIREFDTEKELPMEDHADKHDTVSGIALCLRMSWSQRLICTHEAPCSHQLQDNQTPISSPAYPPSALFPHYTGSREGHDDRAQHGDENTSRPNQRVSSQICWLRDGSREEDTRLQRLFEGDSQGAQLNSGLHLFNGADACMGVQT